MAPISNEKVRIIVGVPPAFPSKCIACFKSYHDTYIDFDFNIPEYGAVYFCETCYSTGALALGWAPPREIEAMRGFITEWRTKALASREVVVAELYSSLVDSGVFAGYPGFPIPGLEAAEQSNNGNPVPEPSSS